MTRHRIAVILAATIAVLGIVVIRITFFNQSFESAVIEAVVAVSLLLTAVAFLANEYDRLFRQEGGDKK